MGVDQKCVLVNKYIVTAEDIYHYKLMTAQGFEYKLMIDDLPSATITHVKGDATNDFAQIAYTDGIPVIDFSAIKDGDKHAVEKKFNLKLYNHLHFIIETHETVEGSKRIVGFDVEPMSIDWGYSTPCSYSSKSGENSVHEAQNELGFRSVEEGFSVDFTYSVEFRSSELTWAHRLDHYKKLGNENIHHS